jgi:hypothetical protein
MQMGFLSKTDCHEHFFNAFCGTDITVGAQNATLTLSSCPGASIE